MIIFHLTLCGLSIKRGTLFGLERHEYPVLVIRGLIFTAAVLRGAPASLFREAVVGLMDDPEWLTKNARSIRLHRRRMAAKIRAEMEARYRGELERAWGQVTELSSKSEVLLRDNFEMRRAIQTFERVHEGEL